MNTEKNPKDLKIEAAKTAALEHLQAIAAQSKARAELDRANGLVNKTFTALGSAASDADLLESAIAVDVDGKHLAVIVPCDWYDCKQSAATIVPVV